VVSHNFGKSKAPGGSAQGAGIWNGAEISGPPVELTLTDSLIAGNLLAGGHGVDLQGGGLFTTFPITRTRTPIVGNVPDQCFGCGATMSARSSATDRAARAGSRR
jgi:hypothetical protein